MRCVLVTGGTGLVGRALIEALPPDVAVVSLTRHGAAGWSDGMGRSARAASALLASGAGHVVGPCELEHVEHVLGDVTRPQLGLSDVAYRELAARADIVVHAAGVTDYTIPRDVTDMVNVTGTRHAARFAEDAGAPLYHVSTGYIRAQGTSIRGRFGAQVYLDSKRAAEEVAASCTTLAAIARPSLALGHSRDGSSTSFQGLHQLIGLMLRNDLPLLPFPPQTRVDYLPRDVVGRELARLVTDGFRGEAWITAGEQAPTFARVVELLIAFAADAGCHVDPPRFVTREMIDRLLRPMGGPVLARRVELLLALTAHLTADALPSTLAAEQIDLEAQLLRTTSWWAERTGWALARQAATA
jgi:nucleoside-diphosphate-sugar epimerase